MSAFLTNSGLQKFAVATPESPVTVKYMAIGTGTGVPTENIQSLFNEVFRTEIPNPLRDVDNPRNLEFTGYIPTTVGGWTITEIGLYDDTDSLIAYHLLDESVVKSSPDSALKTDMYPTFVLALSNADDVELFVSSSVNFEHSAITNRNHPNAHNIASITGLVDELAQSVKITGDQTINGNKRFNYPIAVDAVKTISGDASLELMDKYVSLGVDQSNYVSLLPSQATIKAGLSSIVINGKVNQIYFTGQMIGDGSGLNQSTVSKKGVIRLAEDQEVIDGANVVAAVTPNQISMTGFGSSTQRWQNIISSRLMGVTYTNTTGRGISVYAFFSISDYYFYIDDVLLPVNSSSVFFIVPNGSKYRVESKDGLNIEIRQWWELR